MSARILWIDATAGAAGDMLLGALVDLGVPLSVVREAASALPISGFTLSSRRVSRGGIAAKRVHVRVAGKRRDDEHLHPEREASKGHGRNLAGIRRVLERGRLDPRVRKRALDVFSRLFEAEGKVHGLSPSRVHLHEAGAVDALVDVVGVAAAVEALGVDRIVVSPVTTGRGTVRSAHGILPVPAPAVLELLRGVPVSGVDAEGERLTPTGAALLVCLADGWGPHPRMVQEGAGTGAGSLDDPLRPNVVRVVLGRAPAEDAGTGSPEIEVLTAAIDDAPPQVVAFAVERLLAEGALDAYAAPVVMKKGRLGQEVTVLARPEDGDRLARILLSETTTLGLRRRRESRVELDRRVERVATRWGKVSVKIGILDGTEIQAWPEYEECAKIARARGIPLREIQREVLSARERARGRR